MPILAHKVKIKDLPPDLQRGRGGQEYGGLNEGIVEEVKPLFTFQIDYA